MLGSVVRYKKERGNFRSHSPRLHSLQPLLNVLHWKKERRERERKRKKGRTTTRKRWCLPGLFFLTSRMLPVVRLYLNVNGYEVWGGEKHDSSRLELLLLSFLSLFFLPVPIHTVPLPCLPLKQEEDNTGLNILMSLSTLWPGLAPPEKKKKNLHHSPDRLLYDVGRINL